MRACICWWRLAPPAFRIYIALVALTNPLVSLVSARCWISWAFSVHHLFWSSLTLRWTKALAVEWAFLLVWQVMSFCHAQKACHFFLNQIFICLVIIIKPVLVLLRFKTQHFLASGKDGGFKWAPMPSGYSGGRLSHSAWYFKVLNVYGGAELFLLSSSFGYESDDHSWSDETMVCPASIWACHCCCEMYNNVIDQMPVLGSGVHPGGF